MLASAETVTPAASTTLYFEPLHDRHTIGKPSQRAFKKHKVLPHPRNNRPPSIRHSRNLSIDTTPIPESHVKTEEPSTPPNPKHDESPNVKAPGPALPPTPPAHSRTSSGSRSIQPSSPTYVGSPMQSATNAPASTTPRTPPHQASPPTPDVTPPQLERRSIPPRPILAERIPSKATDSRTESFTTARENLDSSEDDDKSMTPRAVLSSSKATQNLGKRVIDARQKKATGLGLGLALESDDNLTPRSKRDFSAFDGEWGSASEIEQEWDNKYERNAEVEKRRVQPTTNGQKPEVVEDVTVTPTNAMKLLRSAPLSDRSHAHPSPPSESVSKDKRSAAPSTTESLVSIDVKRSSGMSSRSTVSTVVEAVLVGTPPQRRKTLRHVRKQTALRDSSSEISPSSSSANTSLRQVESIQGARAPRRVDGTARSESMASTGTTNSIASRKARREVWKNGGIPVVVIPDRKTSMKATGPSSLRSTSSNHSKRSNSLSSAPVSSLSKTKDLRPYFEKPSRRGRSMSESDRSVQVEELTMDFPPIVPLRRSSLSAPTSRNGSRAGSRAGSLTAESLKAHNTFLEQESKQEQEQQQQQRQHRHQPPHVTVERAPPVEYMSSPPNQRQVKPVPSVESHKEALHDHRPLVDNNGDPFFGKRLTAHNTPFSQASVETNGTHSMADISEAMAVNIYPHQNKSVLMVHHMSKPVDPAVAANALQGPEPTQTGDGTKTEKISNNPKIVATGPDGAPATPPQPQFSMDDVDSPLRNPRAPPEPPAIKFIPATPSGLTPTAEKEKMLGNYFEETQKRPSLVRRAFSLRKSTDNVRPSGFLSRTLSLSKGVRRGTAENPALGKSKGTKLHQYPTFEDPPPEESKLHPFWRPAFDDDFDDYDDWAHDIPAEVDTLYQYPPVRGHPPTRRRSLSERMRHTFAILPIDDEDHYTNFDQRSPERRTVKRTPSGRLRVMRHRDSYGTLEWNGRRQSHDYDSDGRPSTAPDNSNKRVWGVEKRVDDRGRRLFPNWQDKLEPYRPQNLQRRLSEHRRQKRTEALRQKISGPREVRDGVGEVVKRNSYKGPSYQTAPHVYSTSNGRTYHQQSEAQPRRNSIRI